MSVSVTLHLYKTAETGAATYIYTVSPFLMPFPCFQSISLDFLNADNAIVAFELEDEYGIMTRVGLHCAPVAHKSLGTYPQGTVRIAFSASNTKEEIDILINALKSYR